MKLRVLIEKLPTGSALDSGMMYMQYFNPDVGFGAVGVGRLQVQNQDGTWSDIPEVFVSGVISD